MSPNQSRGTTAGRVFNDLRNMARCEGRSTDELLVFYVVERFLHRVSRSPYAEALGCRCAWCWRGWRGEVASRQHPAQPTRGSEATS
jgi:hypothetical protein